MKHLMMNQFNDILPLDNLNYQVFCDFDGTLVNIANAPNKIYVNEYIPKLLSDLDQKHQFCLVSGRSLDDLQVHLPIVNFNVFGCHGAEFSPKGQGNNKAIKIDKTLQKIEIKLGDVLFDFPGVMIEEKPYSIAIHYRNYDGDVSFLKGLLDEILSDFSQNVKLLAGKKVYEFCLCNFNKGTAVNEYIDKSANLKLSRTTAIFVGDDTTDEDGFKAINALDGISIRVGCLSNSSAQYYVDDIYEVHAILQHLSQSSAVSGSLN